MSKKQHFLLFLIYFSAVAVCHCTMTSLFVQVTKFMPITANHASVTAMLKAATMT